MGPFRHGNYLRARRFRAAEAGLDSCRYFGVYLEDLPTRTGASAGQHTRIGSGDSASWFI